MPNNLIDGNIFSEAVKVEAGRTVLDGNLCIPRKARGIVVFVHGSGSSRLSPRNQYVAKSLNECGLGTLLFDLLTRQEERVDNSTAQLRFDIELLSERVFKATEWLKNNPQTKALEVGFFGASTGAAAALVCAAQMRDTVKAVVSRGGRPDLAFSALGKVTAPTLLIVGGKDHQVIELNRRALLHLPETTESSLEIIPGATHLFEESGALEKVSELAGDWFNTYLQG